MVSIMSRIRDDIQYDLDLCDHFSVSPVIGKDREPDCYGEHATYLKLLKREEDKKKTADGK